MKTKKQRMKATSPVARDESVHRRTVDAVRKLHGNINFATHYETVHL